MGKTPDQLEREAIDALDEPTPVMALEPIQQSALEGASYDGVSALGGMSEAEFAEKLAALVRGRDRVELIKTSLMVENVHFGTIPGTPKPSLWQPGAQLLCMIFGLRASFVQDVEYGDGATAPAVRVRTLCRLHLGDIDGPIVGTGNGAASTWERKHRYRRGDRACPDCGTVGSIIRGKKEYGGGWVCWKKKDGCGAGFEKNDQRITGQQVGDVENDDQHDLENTVIKVSEKRAYLGATLRVTASSGTFTQDTERGDGPQDDGGRPGPPEQQPPIEQPRASNGTDPAPGDGIVIAELFEARAMFPADDSQKVKPSQIGRLRNLAMKAGWTVEGVDEEIAKVLSMHPSEIPAVGDAYEAICRWFNSNPPEGGGS